MYSRRELFLRFTTPRTVRTVDKHSRRVISPFSLFCGADEIMFNKEDPISWIEEEELIEARFDSRNPPPKGAGFFDSISFHVNAPKAVLPLASVTKLKDHREEVRL
jgi:hypothetical protein